MFLNTDMYYKHVASNRKTYVWSVALCTNNKVLIAQRIYVMYNIQTEYCCFYEMKNW